MVEKTYWFSSGLPPSGISRLFIILLFISILSVQVQAQCDVTINIDSPSIDPDEDNSFQVCLGGPLCVIPDNIPIKFEVIDPDGERHEYHGLTDAAGCTIRASYLKQFDNSPDTDISGRYYIIASSPDNWNRGDFVVNVVACENVIYNTALMAERQVTIGSLPEMTPSDVVSCCHLSCCHNLTLDSDCNYVAAESTLPMGELHVGFLEPLSFGYFPLCYTGLPVFPLEYTSINASKYYVIGEEVSDSRNKYWIIDISKDGCILADITTCELTTKRLLIEESVYRAYVINELAHVDPLCRGFYTVEMPWPYEINTSRYFDIYGDLTDFLYCHLTPPLIAESKWCHLINLDWYSAVDLRNDNLTFITAENIEDEKEWNNLSGYIVLGHACPLTRNISSLEVCGPRKPIIRTPNDNSTFAIAYSITFDSILSQPYGSTACLPPPAGTFPGPPYTFRWDFGDGGFAFGQTVNHAYNLEGEYNVTLQVSYPGIPGSTKNSILLHIIDPSPLPGVFAPLSVSILEPTDGICYMSGFNIDFDGIVAGGTPPIGGSQWDFGDGGLAAGNTVTHAYAAVGNYTVVFQCNDALGIATDSITIHIVPWQPTIINAKCRDITDGPTLPLFEHETEFEFEIWNPDHTGNSINTVSAFVVAKDYTDCDADDEEWFWGGIGDINSLDSFYLVHSNFCDEEAGMDIKFEINITATLPPNPANIWTFCANCSDADGSDCDIKSGAC